MNSEKYGNGTRIGAPFSSRGEGTAHPNGRFDVTKKPAGDGHMILNAHIAGLIDKCESVEEAVKLGINPDLASNLIATRKRSAAASKPLENK